MVDDFRAALLLELNTALSNFRVSRALQRWIDPILAARGVDKADVAAGIHVRVLRHLCSLEHRVVRLARGEYNLGDWPNEAHYRNGPRPERPTIDANAPTLDHFAGPFITVHRAWRYWEPEWLEGYGKPLEIAAGVELIGQEGVQFEVPTSKDPICLSTLYSPLPCSPLLKSVRKRQRRKGKNTGAYLGNP